MVREVPSALMVASTWNFTWWLVSSWYFSAFPILDPWTVLDLKHFLKPIWMLQRCIYWIFSRTSPTKKIFTPSKKWLLLGILPNFCTPTWWLRFGDPPGRWGVQFHGVRSHPDLWGFGCSHLICKDFGGIFYLDFEDGFYESISNYLDITRGLRIFLVWWDIRYSDEVEVTTTGVKNTFWSDLKDEMFERSSVIHL